MSTTHLSLIHISWPQAEWVLGDDGGRYIWLYRDNYNTSYAACPGVNLRTPAAPAPTVQGLSLIHI